MKQQRAHFARLLLTDVVGQSISLSKCLMQELSFRTGVSATPVCLSHITICVDSTLGVFARNLALTRSVRSPVPLSSAFLILCG